MKRQRSTISIGNHRRGLAPLEMVLALPLLLLVTALMVNFGDAGRWKIRAQANTHYAATRSLRFRSGEFDPNPLNWRAPAGLGQDSGPVLTDVDPFWDSGSEITTPAVRGPQISDPWAGSSIRVKRELEMHDGVHSGNSQIRRRFHQAYRAMPDGGEFAFNLDKQILDRDWHFGDLGYAHTFDRRARLWYAIEPDELGLGGLQGNLDQALAQLQANPTQFYLSPLDEDDEFLIYRLFAPNFIPDPPGGCMLEAADYRLSPQFANFLQDIRRRPGIMASAFISMYQAEIARQRGNPPQVPPQPPPPGGEHWTILEQKVQQLLSFRNNLPAQYR